MPVDPVCGMEVDEAAGALTAEYEGRTYYFCSPGCRTAFEETPERYLQTEGESEG